MATERKRQFEAAALPHLDAAYNIARWLMRDDHDAQDVVQEAYLHAFRFFDSFHGGSARPWLLGIVCNTCYTWLEKSGCTEQVEFDEERDREAGGLALNEALDNPENVLIQKLEKERVDEAIHGLPPAFRESWKNFPMRRSPRLPAYPWARSCRDWLADVQCCAPRSIPPN